MDGVSQLGLGCFGRSTSSGRRRFSFVSNSVGPNESLCVEDAHSGVLVHIDTEAVSLLHLSWCQHVGMSLTIVFSLRSESIA